MQIDHAMARFYSLVKASVSDVSGIHVAWTRFQGNIAYPWVSLQTIVGPLTSRVQRTQTVRQSVEVTVLAGTVGDQVSCVIGGRYLVVAHTGTASTTATALEAIMPSTWTTTVAGAVITVTGPDVFGGAAYFGLEIENTEVGDPVWVNCYRRDTTIQTDVWTQLDRNGRPARWDLSGCDTLALRIRDALWDHAVDDPWRIVLRPSDVIRPMSESYPDSREYARASFDTVVSWLDIVVERQYAAETGVLEEASGTIETSEDGTAFVIEEFTIDESLDP